MRQYGLPHISIAQPRLFLTIKRGFYSTSPARPLSFPQLYRQMNCSNTTNHFRWHYVGSYSSAFGKVLSRL